MSESKATRSKFYGAGDMKGVTRRDILEMTLAMASEVGEDWDEEKSEMIVAATEYEIARLDAANAKRREASGDGGGEKKSRMESAYMVEIIDYCRKLAPDSAQTPEWFIEQFDEKGYALSDKKKFALVSVRQALSHMASTGELVKEQVVVETVGADGLKSQRRKPGYRK